MKVEQYQEGRERPAERRGTRPQKASIVFAIFSIQFYFRAGHFLTFYCRSWEADLTNDVL